MVLQLTAKTDEELPAMASNHKTLRDDENEKHNRLSYAETLVMQLPNDHDGRNTWLLNFGQGLEAESLRAYFAVPFNSDTLAARCSEGKLWSIKGDELRELSTLEIKRQHGEMCLQVVK